MSRQEKIRYNIVVRSSSRGIRKGDFTFNHTPYRPGTVQDAFEDAVFKQYEHLGFGVKYYSKVTKYPVRGIRLRGAGVDGTDVVAMWCHTTKACVLIKLVRV